MKNNKSKDNELKEMTEVEKTAKFYGFQPIFPPDLIKQDFDNVKNLDSSLYPEEKAALLRTYFDEKMFSLPQPVMFYCERPFRGSKEKKKHLKLEGSLVSMGSAKSVCECLSIQTALSILSEIGYKNLEVQINSVGDKESMGEFQKKLGFFIRKNFNSFPADLRQEIKKNQLSIIRECREEWKNLQIECPKPIDFLSENSRLLFKEVLEFLETMGISYSINHHLFSDPDIGTETVFSIEHEGEVLAHGFRFNRLAKKIGFKKDLSCTILNISAKLKKELKKTKVRTVKPQFYLIQFGPEAKLKSFLILNELFKAKVSVVHSIAKDKLGGQIGTAESSGIPYIILVGQKEALENSVVIRNTSTRAQEIIPIPEIASRVKELIK